MAMQEISGEPNGEPTTPGTGLRQAMSGHRSLSEMARQAMSSVIGHRHGSAS
jgi:hypothetical protein